MSVSLIREKRPYETLALEIPIAFQRIYKQYWEPAIEELRLRWIVAPSCFGKDRLDDVLQELVQMKEWTLKNVSGADQEYILMRIDGLEKGIPSAFDKEDTVLHIG